MNINNINEIENYWCNYWIDKNMFISNPDIRQPYTIVMPPPNITGILHMGHVLNLTIHDILIRLHRMKGYNACLVPGIDHASISTEIKVLKFLKEKYNIDKYDISRDKFIKYVNEWKYKYSKIIIDQIKKIGISCDWSKFTYTMSPNYYNHVQDIFIELYNKGFIYKDYKMVNWDPHYMTTISDEEVIKKQYLGKLYYIKYKIIDSNENIIIATSRPETIMADVALCFNNKDIRYNDLKNKKALIPIINKEIPFIKDEYVDQNFGSGCIKVSPAHDINDYKIALRHKLPIINIFNDNGTINNNSPILNGMDRFVAREKIVQMLSNEGSIHKISNYKAYIRVSDRTKSILEYKLMPQWYLKMKYFANLALESLKEEKIKILPKKHINTYINWLNNIHDWCISRQLWWGHRIPIWYYNNEYVAAKDIYKAIKIFELKYNKTISIQYIKQDNDILDTWFSSWLWPIKVFNEKNFNYYYPTNIVITAPEILFFWVIRMVIAGILLTKKTPFKNIYLTGIVRDKNGKKMSKSLGNSPDINNLIKKYGADSIRISMILASKTDNDVLFDESYCKQGYIFINKIWNSFLLIKNWQNNFHNIETDNIIIKWFDNKINKLIYDTNILYDKYDISGVFIYIYKMYKEDFCSFYLEIIKSFVKNNNMNQKYYNKTLEYLKYLLKILHPFIPFITEEIWSKIQCDSKILSITRYPKSSYIDMNTIYEMNDVQYIIHKIRNIIKKHHLNINNEITLYIKSNNKLFYEKYKTIISIFINIKDIIYDVYNSNCEECFLLNDDIIGVNIIVNNINKDIIEDIKLSIQKKIDILTKFKNKINIKIKNNYFLTNAPKSIIQKEYKKYKDVSIKIDQYKQQINSLLIRYND